jgi:hypothetical protein
MTQARCFLALEVRRGNPYKFIYSMMFTWLDFAVSDRRPQNWRDAVPMIQRP